MDTFYYQTKLKGGHDTKMLIVENCFWTDFAQSLIYDEKCFISSNFTQCTSLIEQFLCQVVLDLPDITDASIHQYKADKSRGVNIIAGSSAIIFKKEIKEVEVDIKQDFIVTHRYKRIDEYGLKNYSIDDEAVPREFLINVPYECEVIMTNVS